VKPVPRRVRLLIVAAVAVVVVAAAVALITHKSHRATIERLAGSTGSTAPASGSQAAAQSVAPPAPPANSAIPRFRPPAFGTYRYRFQRTGAAPADFQATDVVAPAAGGFTDTRDHQSVKVSRTDVVTKDGGVRETHFAFASQTGRTDCRWDKPVTVIPDNPKPGKRWTSKASCATAVGTTATHIDYDATSEVVGLRTAKVGDAAVELLRIDRKVVITTTAKDQTAVRHSIFVDYFDTARGLLAQSTEDATDTAASGSSTYRIVEAMLTLQPEVPR
jgi:hypothetical protein